MKVPAIILGVAVVAGAAVSAQIAIPTPSPSDNAGVPPLRLSPTSHPPVPNDLASMWLVPAQGARLGPALTNFVRGVKLLEDDNRAAAALPLVSDGALSTTPVADYARYYTGLALTKLNRYAEADKVFSDLAARHIDGHLPEDAALRLGDIREAQKDYPGAVEVYESLLARKLAQPHVAWLKLGLAAEQASLTDRAIDALRRVYYEYPLSPEAERAREVLAKRAPDLDPDLVPKELARADVLFQARRWAAAKVSYDRVKPLVNGAARDRIVVRRAAAEIGLGRNREGRDALRPFLSGALAEEANF